MRLQSIIVILIYVILNQTLQFIFCLILSTIYITLYIILLKYIFISKKITNLNANKYLIKINYIWNKNIIVEFVQIDAIQYTQEINKSIVDPKDNQTN